MIDDWLRDWRRRFDGELEIVLRVFGLFYNGVVERSERLGSIYDSMYRLLRVDEGKQGFGRKY